MFESFIKENNRMPSETEARKFGRADRTKTIFQTGGKEVTEDDVRNKLINEGKPAETFKKKVIFRPYERLLWGHRTRVMHYFGEIY